jgi:hypothetical protein
LGNYRIAKSLSIVRILFGIKGELTPMRQKPIHLHEQWFDIPDDEDGGKLLIRETTPGSGHEIALAGGVRAQESGISPQAEFFRELIVRYIADWQNVMDEKGTKLPCTYANKLSILEQENMYEFVLKSMDAVRKEGEKIRANAKKN